MGVTQTQLQVLPDTTAQCGTDESEVTSSVPVVSVSDPEPVDLASSSSSDSLDAVTKHNEDSNDSLVVIISSEDEVVVISD